MKLLSVKKFKIKSTSLCSIDSDKPTFPQFYGELTPIENNQSIHCIALDLIAGNFMRQYPKGFQYSICCWLTIFLNLKLVEKLFLQFT